MNYFELIILVKLVYLGIESFFLSNPVTAEIMRMLVLCTGWVGGLAAFVRWRENKRLSEAAAARSKQ